MIAKAFSTGVDWLVVSGLRTFLIGRAHHKTDPEELATVLDAFENGGPDDVFPAPGSLSQECLKVHEVSRWWKGKMAEFRFPSEVQTGCAVNDNVHARLISSKPLKGKPVLILVPGWIIGHQDPLLLYFGAPLTRHGIVSVVFQPPYQIQRKPKGHFTGELTISGNMVRTFHAIRQGVSDVRKLIAILRANGAGRIGIMGLSMGAWITSLVAVSEPDLALSAIVVPPVDLSHVITESPLVTTIRKDVAQSGIDVESVNRLSRLLSPLSYPLRMPKEGVRLSQAVHDYALPPKGTQDLWEHWGRPCMRRYRAGHISIIFTPRFMRDFFRDCRETLL